MRLDITVKWDMVARKYLNELTDIQYSPEICQVHLPMLKMNSILCIQKAKGFGHQQHLFLSEMTS